MSQQKKTSRISAGDALVIIFSPATRSLSRALLAVRGKIPCPKHHIIRGFVRAPNT
jgi:hypothetical protein